MKSFVNTVVGGAIGLIALYVVGRVAYQAGQDMAQAEQRYEEVCKKTKTIESKLNCGEEAPSLEEAKSLAVIEDEPVHRTSKFGLLFGIKRLISKKESVIGRLVHNPEAHRIEAFIEGDEIKLNVKPKTA